MTDREVLQAIAARLQTLITAAHDLDQFVNSLASEAERSENRIRELAGSLIQPTSGNGGPRLVRRGRPPGSNNAKSITPPAPNTSTPPASSESEVRIVGE